MQIRGSAITLRDESEWIKIPDHHPAIVSKEVFERVQERYPRRRIIRKNTADFALRDKVFCGCCRHTMQRRATKFPAFACKRTEVDESAPCHGLKITESDLETILFEIISRQAKVIMNLDRLANAGLLDLQLAKQDDYHRRIEGCLDKKRVLYERLVLREVSVEEYRSGKAEIDKELQRLKKIHAALTEQTAHMQMQEKAKSARVELAQKIIREDSLTAELADALIERVYVYPGNQVEIVWKTNDFCMEEM